ncbi:spermidine synthase [Flavobacterium sp.]|uniref:spermidine synthase n=1 Tax=Flavobacterium sp. TaxID=239 RepID=UPI003D0ECA33
MTILKKIISYLYPLKEFEAPSITNKSIEVNWNNGKLVLDSKNTNFSFGSLERVMRFGLKKISASKISEMKSALVLGVAGGSVISLLQNEFSFQGNTTGIEIDEKMISIANQFFHLQKLPKVNIIHKDAQDYLLSCKTQYDLIIVDIFEDNLMPEFLFTQTFIQQLKTILTQNGFILFNTIVSLNPEKIRNQNFENILTKNFNLVQKYSNIEGNNEVFIICH